MVGKWEVPKAAQRALLGENKVSLTVSFGGLLSDCRCKEGYGADTSRIEYSLPTHHIGSIDESWHVSLVT